MKTTLPWIVAALALTAAAYFFNAGKSASGRLAAMQQQVQELQQLREENAALKTNELPAEELVRLRKDSADAIRLRNEVRQLRTQASQLTQQAQAAQAAADHAQALAVQATEYAHRSAPQSAAGRPEAAGGGGVAGSPQDLMNSCINQFRQIDGAKQQWALEHSQPATATPEVKDLLPYLGQTLRELPRCPAGGQYTIGAITVAPACSISGHALPIN